MKNHHEELRELIAQQAAEWYLTNREEVHSEEERIAFAKWLRVSPVHVQEYLGIASVARDLAPASADSAAQIEMILAAAARAESDNVESLTVTALRDRRQPDATVTPRIWQRRPVWATAAMLLVVAGAWAFRVVGFADFPQSYRTVHGEQSSWPLPDGSVLHLNSDSRVTVRFSKRERIVEVERGQAHFQVAHEARRRFRVVTDATEVVAVGTEFDVYRQHDATVVTVVEGRVAVFHGAAPPPADPAVIPADAMRLGAGQQVRVDPQTSQMKPTAVDLRQAMAWMHRQIVFEQRALVEVVDEFNRYGTTPIQIDDPQLRVLPVSGVFNAYDTESFAAFLKRLDGVVVDVTGDKIRVRRVEALFRPIQK